MKYYAIDNDGEETYTREGTGRYDINMPNNQGDLDWDYLPNYEPVFSHLLIPPVEENGYTEVVEDGGAIGGIGIIMTQRLKEIFQEFNLGEGVHRFYPLISADCETLEVLPDIHYHYLQVVDLQANYPAINFEKSTFFVKDRFKPDKTYVAISNTEQLNATYYEYADFVLSFEKLVLNETFKAMDLDMFYFSKLKPKTFTYIIISQRLLDGLRREGLLKWFKYKEVPIFVE